MKLRPYQDTAADFLYETDRAMILARELLACLHIEDGVANLRGATHAQNTRNAKIRKNSTSGVKNVRRRAGGRWEVRLRVDGRCVSFGCFASLADASAAAAKARETAFGEFARHA